MDFGTVKCPTCGLELHLRPHSVKSGRLVAYCNHGIPSQMAREVYETDEPQAPSEEVAAPKEE